jgi:hypothetical protein
MYTSNMVSRRRRRGGIPLLKRPLITKDNYFIVVRTNLGTFPSAFKGVKYNYQDEIITDSASSAVVRYFGQMKRRSDGHIIPGAILFDGSVQGDYIRPIGVITHVTVVRPEPEKGPIEYRLRVCKVSLPMDNACLKSADSDFHRWSKGGVAGALGVRTCVLKGNFKAGIVGPSVPKNAVPPAILARL